jgi:hypothetical protein
MRKFPNKETNNNSNGDTACLRKASLHRSVVQEYNGPSMDEEVGPL